MVKSEGRQAMTWKSVLPSFSHSLLRETLSIFFNDSSYDIPVMTAMVLMAQSLKWSEYSGGMKRLEYSNGAVLRL